MGRALERAREKLSGWLGGPSLYTDRFGHPMLRARHLPFSIGDEERDQWMECMIRTMEETDVPPLPGQGRRKMMRRSMPIC